MYAKNGTDTEFVILRVAWNCRSRYEWGPHVDIGLRTGLALEDVSRVTLGPDAEGWSQRQQAILKAADDIHSERMVSETTWHSLLEFFDNRFLLELLLLIGFYEGLAGVLNSTGLPLDAEPEKILLSLVSSK
jgi:alkylhydroperoxidase family enzyme